MKQCKCENPNIGEHCDDGGTCYYQCNTCGLPVGDEKAFFTSPPAKELEQPKKKNLDWLLVVFVIAFMLLSLILLGMYWSARVELLDIYDNYTLIPK